MEKDTNVNTPCEAMLPRREKYWAELDADGKTSRMHQVVKNLIEQVADLKRDVAKLKEASIHHSHSQFTGLPVVPAGRSGAGHDEDRGYRPKREEEYF